MYKVVLTNYGNTQISNKVVLDGVILLADYIANISSVTSVAGYSVKLDIPARGNVKDKIGNILIRDDTSNTYIAKTILFYKNVNSEKKIIAGFSQNTAIINKSSKSVNLFLSFDFSSFTNGFQFALVQAGFSPASQNVDGLVHIEDPDVEFDDSYSVYSKVQIDNKLASYAQTSAIPTKTSQLTNDSNYINKHQSIKTINNNSLVGTGNITINQGEYNKINTISVNSTNQIPDSNKNVNITVPTKVSQLDNDLGFITSGVVPTNYVTVNTAQNITAAKTFKNSTDTTKIDGKEIVISGTSDFLRDYDILEVVADVPIINKLSSSNLSYDDNNVSVGYHREYHTLESADTGSRVDYSKGILLRSEYSGTGGNDPSSEYSIYIASQHTRADYNLGGIYIRHLQKGEDNVIQPENIISIDESGINFSRTTYFDWSVYLKDEIYTNPYNLQLSTDNISYESLSDYVKQASLYYNRANSVITATSDTVIEPSSNNTISLGTSTNGFRNIYACGGSETNSIIIGYDTSSMTDDAVIIPSVGSTCYVGTTSNHFMGGYIDNIYSKNITVSNEGQLSVYGNTDTNGIKLCNDSDQTNYAMIHGDSHLGNSADQESGNLGYASIVLDYYANNQKRASIVSHCEFIEGGSYPEYSMYPVSHTGSSGSFSLGTSANRFSNIYAYSIYGTLHGNATSATTADSATKATQDGNGNTISSYYCTLSTAQTISGKKTFDGNNVDFILKDNERNISFRYSPTYQSWTWITCYNETNNNNIKLHFTNNNKDVIQLTHTCTSTSSNNVQRVSSLVTGPSVDNVWQLGAVNKRLSNIYTTTLSLTHYAVTNGTYHPSKLSVGGYGIQSDSSICPSSNGGSNLGNGDCKWETVYTNNLGTSGYPVETMHISGGHANKHIVIDNSGGEPTIAPDTTNYGYLGTSSKHWFTAYINDLHIGSNGDSLLAYIANSLSGHNSTITNIGSIRVIRISVTNKDSDSTIFSAGSNVSGYTIYQGSIANGTFNYKSSALTGTWKLLSELMTPSGINSDTYTGSLYAIAIRIA